jgi:hypothetical protein
MKAIGGVIRAPLKAIGLIPTMPKPPPAAPSVTRDNARDAALQQDVLFGRRGGAADQITGTKGAEAGRAATGAATLG